MQPLLISTSFSSSVSEPRLLSWMRHVDLAHIVHDTLLFILAVGREYGLAE